jgi:serine/threonine protein kinase
MSIKLATAFLDRVQRSGLIAKEDMPQLRQDLEVQGVDLSDARAIADALVERAALTRWQADKVLEGKHKGFFLGSYRLLRPLGRGGMGAVFLAQHEMMRRRCAIKVLPHSQIKEGSSVLKRFYVEAQAVAALDHQNIVRAYDVAVESKDGKDTHYLVMEYVEGHDLQTLVQEQGVLDYVKTAEYLRQTANGLAHAHEAGLLHRDIKPANLLVDPKGVVKILDLGLARFFDDSQQASLTKAFNETVLGTADYLSPEQALNSHTVDHRTDIYSLGCTAYFLLVGTPPFPEGTVAQRLVAHQVKSPDSIKEKRTDAPPSLVAIIDKMMAKKPEDRFQSAADIATILAGWLIEFGGDDWKRQHSEITGDRALMSLLKAREPTRTIRSSMSETELELAPLEDDDADAGMISASDESGSNLNLSGSAVRKAGGSSTSGSRPAASGDRRDDLSPVVDEDQPGSTTSADDAESDAAARVSDDADDASSSPSLDEATAGLQPLEDLEVADLSSLGTEDLLGDLSAQDLGGTGDDPLGAMDSDLRQVALSREGSSVSKSHRRSESGVSKASPASESTIGMPILIGGAGGLLLVLIIFAMMPRSSDPETPQLASDQPAPTVTSEETEPSPDAKLEPSVAPEDPTPAAEPLPPEQGSPGSESEESPPPEFDPAISTEPFESQEEDEADPADALATNDTSADPSTVAPSSDQPQPDVPDRAEDAADDPTLDTSQTEAPLPVIAPEVYLATMEGFRVDWKGWSLMGQTPGKIPPQLTPLLRNAMTAAARELNDTVVNRYRLKVDSNQAPLLTIEPLMMVQAPNILLGMRAHLTVEDESGQEITLWSKEQELASFTPAAGSTVVMGYVRKGLGHLFGDFRDKYEAAVADHANPADPAP